MKNDILIIILGIWVAIMPFLGFPRSWETLIFAVSGVSIAVLAFALRGKLIAYSSRIFTEKRTDTFVENGAANLEHREEK